MPLPEQSWSAWRAGVTAVQILAVMSTAFRLCHRRRNQGWWWDDYLAMQTCALDVTLFVSMWGWLPPGTGELHHTSRVFFFWIALFVWILEIWSARVCLALSITRIFPPDTRSHQITLLLVPLFVLMAVVLIILTATFCTTELIYDIDALVWCHFPKKLYAVSFAFDVVADLCLIACSIRSMRRVRLPKRRKRLVTVGLISSIWMSPVSVGIGVLTFGPRDWGLTREMLIILMAHMNAAIALICCNLLVIVICLHRKIRRWRHHRRTFQNSISDDEWHSDTINQPGPRPTTSQTSGGTGKSTRRSRLPQSPSRPDQTFSQTHTQTRTGTSIILTDVDTSVETDNYVHEVV